MSTAYYYFAASLPVLEFGAKPPLSMENFLEDCGRLLSPDDFADIKKAVSDDGLEEIAGCGVLKEWKQLTRNFRNEAVWFRAHQINKDPLDHIRGERIIDPSAASVLAHAAKSPDPLTGERMIDEFLWQKLDELVPGHYFDIEFLIVYAAKLGILERYREIESLKGKEILAGYKVKVGER